MVQGISYQAGCSLMQAFASYAPELDQVMSSAIRHTACRSCSGSQTSFSLPLKCSELGGAVSGMGATIPAMFSTSSAQFLCSNSGGGKRRNQKGDRHSATPTTHRACQARDFQWLPHKFGVPLEEREAAPVEAELQEMAGGSAPAWD